MTKITMNQQKKENEEVKIELGTVILSKYCGEEHLYIIGAHPVQNGINKFLLTCLTDEGAIWSSHAYSVGDVLEWMEDNDGKVVNALEINVIG